MGSGISAPAEEQKNGPLSRRDFLKLFGVYAASLFAMPPKFKFSELPQGFSGKKEEMYPEFSPMMTKEELDRINNERIKLKRPPIVQFPFDYRAQKGRTGYLESMGNKRGDRPVISGWFFVTWVKPWGAILYADMDPPPFYLPIQTQGNVAPSKKPLA